MMKNTAEKAKESDETDNDYYSSPMAKKKWILQKIKANAMQALKQMLDLSLKTHAGEDVGCKNLKELFYSLKIFYRRTVDNKRKVL